TNPAPFLAVMEILAFSTNRPAALWLALSCFGLIAASLCEPSQAAVSNAPLPPASPTNLTATAVSSSQIYLSWTDNSNNEARFRIERSRDGTTFWRINVVGGNVTAYTDSVRQPSTTYYYRVCAVASGGNSAYSNTASATTAPSPAPSPTPAATATPSTAPTRAPTPSRTATPAPSPTSTPSPAPSPTPAASPT